MVKTKEEKEDENRGGGAAGWLQTGWGCGGGA